MTRIVLIGKDRRITLEELQSVCVHDGTLEMHDSSIDGLSDDLDDNFLSSAVSKLNIQNEEDTDRLLTPNGTLATLTLFAQAISQNRILPPTQSSDISLQTSNAIVQLVNYIKSSKSTKHSFALSASASSFLASLRQIFPTSIADNALLMSEKGASTASTPPALSTLVRLIPLAVSSLSTVYLQSLTKSNVIDALAYLSVERTCIDPQEYYAEMDFDINRPHKGMIASAAVLRACTQGSKFATKKAASMGHSGRIGTEEAPKISNDNLKAIQSIPQIHGPCTDAIDSACKVLELECNCIFRGQQEEFDPSTLELATRTVVNASVVLLKTCLARMNQEPMEVEKEVDNNSVICGLMELAQALEKTTIQLTSNLEKEARMNEAFVTNEIKLAMDSANEKAEKKAAAAAIHAEKNASGGKDSDEFKGMSQEKIEKIMKKRAKKAAKKKSSSKKSGPVTTPSIFGIGSKPILSTLQSNDYNLNNSTILSDVQTTIASLFSGGLQRKPKIAKGTQDYHPEQMMIRDKAFEIIRRVFKSHGALEIDTPVFELKATLTGKYGEDSKLIYDLADQGGEMLALRYDLTVPFARYLALHEVGNIKRYHIGKVYRRDQPQLSKGRFREFYQCDFDIAGSFARMVPDSECLCVASEILSALPIGSFAIKLNHRRLLDAILDLCGVPAEKFRTICSAVDKLDKAPWEDVKKEMVEDKGLSENIADKIGVFVLQKGNPWDMYKSLMESKVFGDHTGANEAMEDLKILFGYLDAMDKLHYISFDLSLARGLDYYTGVIYEAVSMNEGTQVGSIGGGGRYDNLVSMFQKPGKVTPCVGVSVGIERVFALMEERLREKQGGSIKQPNVQVLIAQAGKNMMTERMKIGKLLWDSKISAEYNQQENPKLKGEIEKALDRDIPFMVIIGEDEAKEKKCKLKDLKARSEETIDQVLLVSTLRQKGVVPVGCEFAAEMLAAEGKDVTD